jgi:hypothetical protein
VFLSKGLKIPVADQPKEFFRPMPMTILTQLRKHWLDRSCIPNVLSVQVSDNKKSAKGFCPDAN